MSKISSHWSGLVLAFALSAILVACSGGGPAPTAAPGAPTLPPTATAAPTSPPVGAPTAAPVAVDMCSLLTVEEVSAAYEATEDHSGDPLVGAVASSAETYSYCQYGAEREVSTWINSNAGTSSMVFNTMKINDGEAVSGVGDEAYWSTDQFQPGLYFMKGGILAFISGSVFGPEAPIIELGKLLASRM